MYLRERWERGVLVPIRNGEERAALASEAINDAAPPPREEIDRKMDLAAVDAAICDLNLQNIVQNHKKGT